MITELCITCWLYHSPGADCRKANALGQAWLVKPPVDEPAIEPEEVAEEAPKTKRKYTKRAK
jgi:hypothetical protein